MEFYCGGILPILNSQHFLCTIPELIAPDMHFGLFNLIAISKRTISYQIHPPERIIFVIICTNGLPATVN